MKNELEIPTLCLIEMAYQKAEKYKITEKNTPFHKFAIAVEEFGEVSRAMQENKRDEIVQELADLHFAEALRKKQRGAAGLLQKIHN